MALTSGIAINRRGPPSRNEFGYPVAAGEQIWRGSLCAVNAAGSLQRMQTSGSVAFVGMSEQDFSNVGSATVSAQKIVVRKGTWALTVTGATAANINAPVYASDDGTLTLTAGSLLQVGTLAGIENGQTYVNLLGS